MKNQRWTEEDLAKLRRMAGKFPTEEIARALGRPPSAIKMKAYLLKVSLGFRRRRGPRPDKTLNGLPHDISTL